MFAHNADMARGTPNRIGWLCINGTIVLMCMHMQLTSHEEQEVVLKALYALAALVRNLAAVRQQFLDAGVRVCVCVTVCARTCVRVRASSTLLDLISAGRLVRRGPEGYRGHHAEARRAGVTQHTGTQ